MREKLPIPHADRFISKKGEQLSSQEAKRFFDDTPVNNEGKPVTDPKEILRRIFEELPNDPAIFKRTSNG